MIYFAIKLPMVGGWKRMNRSKAAGQSGLIEKIKKEK